MPIEIDFLGLEKQQQHQSSIDRDILKTTESPSPDVLSSMLASNTKNPECHVPFSPSTTRASAPLTIVYNGTLCVFDATHDVAENVMKMAAEGARQLQLQQQKSGFLFKDYYFNVQRDMPLFRKKSLQRFLEKRLERLASSAPYTAGSSSSTNVGAVDGRAAEPTAADAHREHLRRPVKTEDSVPPNQVA